MLSGKQSRGRKMNEFFVSEEFWEFFADYAAYQADYFQRAKAAGVSATDAPCETVAENQMHLSRRSNRLLYSYWSRYMSLMERFAAQSSGVFCLFDASGMVISCYGNPALMRELTDAQVLPLYRWDIEHTGPNAVTVGLAERRCMWSCGEENYHQALQPYAVYFHPISMLDQRPVAELTLRGGVALITVRENASANYFMHLAGICHDLLMNMQFYQISNASFERTERGVILLDTHMHIYPTVTHINQKMFDLFELEPEEIAFQSAELLIDPLPENQEFWELVYNPRYFEDREMVLSVRGRKEKYLISGDKHHQPALNTEGINLYITTSREQTRAVAEQIGNNAVKSFDTIIGKSPSFLAAVKKGRMLTRTDSNIMLMGESGVGKDVFAQAIHNDSTRKNKPFIAINCGALPRDLIASELFGYDSGAFTGAKRQGNIGKFELANGGTLFLDEIGELPLDLQATLLRAVEQKQIMRLGSNRLIDVDVKIISATNADIPAMIEQKLFRADLYYRLSTMQLYIPPLRERGDDIIRLAEYFIDKVSSRIGRKDRMVLSAETKKFLLAYPWQGNIRELQNLMERIVQLYPDPVIELEYVMENVNIQAQSLSNSAKKNTVGAAPPLQQSLRREQLTREKILEALEQCGGNRSEAARLLGVARKTLYRNMERLELE